MNHRKLCKKCVWGGLAIGGAYNMNHRRLCKSRLQHEPSKAWQEEGLGRLGKRRLQHEPSKAWQEEAFTT